MTVLRLVGTQNRHRTRAESPSARSPEVPSATVATASAP
jgi:hypothetical protein